MVNISFMRLPWPRPAHRTDATTYEDNAEPGMS